MGRMQEQIFLGREISQHKDFSEKTAETIDEEVHSLVLNAYDQAMDLLKKHEEALHRLAKALLDREVLTSADLAILMDGKDLGPKIEKNETEGTPATEEEDAGEGPPAYRPLHPSSSDVPRGDYYLSSV